MSEKILLIGGGGHCKSVLDSLIEQNKYLSIGIIDVKENIGSFILGVPVIASDEQLASFYEEGYHDAFVTIGSIGDPKLRISFFELLTNIGFNIPIIIDNSACVSNHSLIQQGVFIGKQCVINAGVEIKKGAIINSGSIIEHDCRIGEFAHVASGTVLGGNVEIGANSHIGSNTTIKQKVNIGSNSIIGIGSVVLNNIDSNKLAYGNPCREVKNI